MTPEYWKRVTELFEAAVEHEPAERADFVARATAGDPALAEELLRLLASDENASAFLSRPPGLVSLDVAAAADHFAGRTLSRYRLDQPLGAGGMGLLYRATDLMLGRSVAVKLLARHLVTDEAAKARFVQEARAASALDHPNIGSVYDIGEQDGELFIVMALYDGETLKHRLEKGPLPMEETLAVLRQVALGLEAAHRAGIVHRDIKPANILTTSSGTVKILDFGVAKLVGGSPARTTQTGQAIGTVAYMSPEQLAGQSVDARSDLWSLGVLAYELLAGVSPFQADSDAATAARVLRDEPTPLSAAPGTPDWLALLPSQLLRKNPAERPQSASEVLRRLEGDPSASSAGLGAWPSSARIPRRLARQRTALVFSAVLLLAIAAAWVARSRILQRPRSPGQSIAVLPFANLTAGEENAYLAEGFHDELLRQIGKIRELRVISRTSVLKYKEGARNLPEISETLGVSSIVEGSVQRAGNRLRVQARLFDAHSDKQIWGDLYDRKLTDLFAIQTAVAEEIASALHARLSAAQRAQIERKPTQNDEAYDLYLRALEYENRSGHDNLPIAERLYHRAIEEDPSFALAHARLARLKLQMYWLVPKTPARMIEEAKQEADESLRLQPDLPEGHLALGYYRYWGLKDYDGALKEFERARWEVPAQAIDAIGLVRRRQGRFDEAVQNLREAAQLDPRSPGKLFQLALTLLWSRKFEEAERALDRVLNIAPDVLEAPLLKAVVREAWKGETELARGALHRIAQRVDSQGRFSEPDFLLGLLERNPREALVLLDSIGPDPITAQQAVYPKAFFYAVAHESLGDGPRARNDYEAARPILEAAVEKNPNRSYQHGLLARTYAGLGRKEDALREARAGVEALPISKDALDGCVVEIYRALVEARVGETDAAIEHIRHLLSIPCLLSPGLLRTDPGWSPLRADPRFGKLAQLDD